MSKEIERQYVVNDQHPEWQAIKHTLPQYRLTQATIHRGSGNKLRVRIIDDLSSGKKTAHFAFKVKKKSKKNGPNIRDEYEWEVPPRVALYIMIGHIEVYKLRHHYTHTDGKVWEIDEYEGANQGVTLADIELEHEDEKYELPSFLGQETTKNKKITNNSFSNHPYSNWDEKEKREYEKLKKKD